MTNEFCIRLKQGPAFLFLGQDALSLETGDDPFLSGISTKYETPIPTRDYKAIFQLPIPEPSDAYAWMKGLCDRLSLPSWLKLVGQYQWSGIYSSSIDSLWPRAFRLTWREIERIYGVKHYPQDSRNKLKLHCTFLYGSVDRTDPDELPPLSIFALSEREQVASSLAARLPELVTPLGTLVIEGYASSRDWFSPEKLYAIINKLSESQAHMFSANEQLINDPFLKHLIDSGKLVAHQDSLSSVLLQAAEQGILTLGDQPDADLAGQTIRLEKSVLELPLHIRNQISRSATVLDDSMLVQPPKISQEKLYAEFLHFLAESSLSPIWTGYARGFAFSRQFEQVLHATVMKALSDRPLKETPIILHGQTGTGKTVALGALAYEIRKARKYPVLFIRRSSHSPLYQDIDAFCSWVEQEAVDATLIVWDGMRQLDVYLNLMRYLAGKGRKAVIVGSSYSLIGEEPSLANFIEAPPVLNEAERAEFAKFLPKFEPSLTEFLARQKRTLDASFLVSLYRLLPATRIELRTGLEREANFSETEILEKTFEAEPAVLKTSLGYAFAKAGLLHRETTSDQAVEHIAGEPVSELRKLTNLVMVPGQFGLPVPLDLLLRALGRSGVSNFGQLMKVARLFVWQEDEIGNITIAARHPLEARLLLQTRLGGPAFEIEYAKLLLTNLSDNDVEIDFAVEFLRSLGPNNPKDPKRYSKYFRDLSQILENLRMNYRLANVRLMLQEAFLLREHIKATESSFSNEVTERDLTKAQQILRDALDLVEESNRWLRSQILAELGTALAYRAQRGLQTLEPDPHSIQNTFEQARRELYKARTADPENLHPVDVIAWLTGQMISSSLMDSSARAESVADLFNLYEICDSEQLGFVHQEQYWRRRHEVMEIVGQHELSENAFNTLAQMGSSAGYYLRATKIAGKLPVDRALTVEERALCKDALKYLEDNIDHLENDGKCNFLMLKLWWNYRSGTPLFLTEHQALPYTERMWMECLQILERLIRLGEPFATPTVRFLEALALFHLGEIQQSLTRFRALYLESMYGSRRIAAYYLASSPSGKPIVYHGNVAETGLDRGKGFVFVEEISKRIPFFPKHFNRPEIRKHESLTFHIAFNFLGPFAVPIAHSKS